MNKIIFKFWLIFLFEFAHLKNIFKFQLLSRIFFSILMCHKPSWGHTKFGPAQFSRFDVYRLQTNKQTKQTDKQGILLDE